MRSRVRNLFGFVFLLGAAPAFSASVSDVMPFSNHRTAVNERLTLTLTDAAERSVQDVVVRATGGVDTSGWILIAVLHGPDAALVQEGQRVRAFSVNARTRLHVARVTRVTRQQNGVRVEATLEGRVLGISTRYLMEIVTGSI